MDATLFFSYKKQFGVQPKEKPLFPEKKKGFRIISVIPAT